MAAPKILVKRYVNHRGVDFKSNEITRPEEFASDMLNAQYRKTKSIEKRPGYQAHGESVGGFGLFTYDRVNPTTFKQESFVLNVGSSLYVGTNTTFSVNYSGGALGCAMSVYFDAASGEYKCEILEDTTVVFSQGLGKGFDEASIYTLADLKTDIDALVGFSATITGDDTIPAAFLKVVYEHDLLISDFSSTALGWVEANKTVVSPFGGSETNKNEADFENVSCFQIGNVAYLSNGYDYVQKFDGQTLYRAGLPDASATVATAAGAIATAGPYSWRVQYAQVDAVGNIVEGNAYLTATQSGFGTPTSFNLTINNILAGSGFNTNCAVVAGAQVSVNTITVDDGSGGSHTMKVGDTAYFYDSISASFVEREVTAVTSGSITIAGAAVTVADNAVISNNLRINIWRNKTAGSAITTWYLVNEIPNNSFSATQVYNDNKADAALGAQFIEPLTDRSAPPKGKYVSGFRNQLVIAGQIEKPNTVYYSDVESPEYFPANTNSFDCYTGAGDIITGLAPNNEVFAIFKSRSIFVVSGNIAENTIRVDQITSDIGCVAHASIQEIRGSLFFLSDAGPRLMTGGQVPTALGPHETPLASRIDPLFEQTAKANDETFILKRAVAFNDRLKEKYLLFLPCESTLGGDQACNSNSRILAYDYSRDAWLVWSAMNVCGGMTLVGDEFYFVEKRYSTFNTQVDHVLYRRHNANSAFDYQDNVDPIEFKHASQWEALGEPNVLKKFLGISIFSIEELPSNSATLTVKTEHNYSPNATKSEFTKELGAGGYGIDAYGVAAYGSPLVASFKHRVNSSRSRSMRVIFENNQDQANVIITGWELEITAPYKPGLKA